MDIFNTIPSLKSPGINKERKKELRLFEKLANVRFRRLELLNLAFSHRSFANENADSIDNNEKLEFLGDSVLGLIISEYLFRILPDRAEGDMSRIKSYVVSEDSLAKIARDIRVDNYILIGKGEEYSGGRNKKAILADCMEAIIGAYYLDSGLKPVRKFVIQYLAPEIDRVLQDKHKKDYKTLLQEYVQKKFKTYPKYRLVEKSGPDHNMVFTMEVEVNSKSFGKGSGKNKKEAEQKAASVAYTSLTGEAPEEF